jgi:hypothetical protein
MLDAIKVARVCPAMPLFGCTMSAKKAMKLQKQYDSIIFWLDKDKYKTAIKLSDQFKYVFGTTGICSTDEDPKEFSTLEIRDKLRWYFKDTS